MSLPMLAAAAPCAASSFVALPEPPPGAAPSMIMLGEPVAPPVEAQPVAFRPAEAEIFTLGPSILAFGAEAIPAAREDVASISGTPAQPAWMSSALPLVLRGGVATADD